MDKKTIGLILGIAAVLIVIVVAAVIMTPTDNSTEVTIVNETFHIPEGFNETYSDNGTSYVYHVYKNGTNATIAIQVDSPSYYLPADDSEVNKTVGGIPGIYKFYGENDPNFRNMYGFRYLHNGNYIKIHTSDEALLEQIIR